MRWFARSALAVCAAISGALFPLQVPARADQKPALPGPAAVLPSPPPARAGSALEPDQLYLQLADAVWSTIAGARS